MCNDTTTSRLLRLAEHETWLLLESVVPTVGTLRGMAAAPATTHTPPLPLHVWECVASRLLKHVTDWLEVEGDTANMHQQALGLAAAALHLIMVGYCGPHQSLGKQAHNQTIPMW